MVIIKGPNDVEQIGDQPGSNTEEFMIARSGYSIKQLYELHIAIWINISDEKTMRPTPQLIHELSQIKLIRII
jgi:hypothetical protein